ncbi:7776_t:CDS:2, partial [Dentiscutata erythropus]
AELKTLIENLASRTYKVKKALALRNLERRRASSHCDAPCKKEY